MKKRLLACMLALTMMLTSIPIPVMASADGMEASTIFSSRAGTEAEIPKQDSGQPAEFSEQETFQEEETLEADLFTDGSAGDGDAVEEAEESAILSGASLRLYQYIKLWIGPEDDDYDRLENLSGLEFEVYTLDNTFVKRIKSEKSSTFGGYTILVQSLAENQHENQYEIRIKDNPFFQLKNKTIIKALSGIGIPTGEILLERKQSTDKSDTRAVVTGWNDIWSGTGTDTTDPYVIDKTVGTNDDDFTFRTLNANAEITYGNRIVKGSINVPVPYGTKEFNFIVKSEDTTATSYYKVTTTRNKYKPMAPLGLKGVSPSVINGNDGKITGLNKNTAYEYKKQGELNYIKVTGISEIPDLEAGTYLVRRAETATWAPSSDATVEVPVPTPHTITLNTLPAGVREIDVPPTMVYGHELIMKFGLSKGKIIDEIKYTYKSGGSSSFHPSDFSYTNDEATGETILTVTTDAMNDDITIDVTLLDETYYQVLLPAGDEKYDVSISGGTGVTHGKWVFYEEGSKIEITAALKQDWIGSSEISSLTAYKMGTTEPIQGTTLDSNSKDKWTLSLTVNEDTEIKHGVTAYPPDFTALDALIAKVNHLKQFLGDTEKKFIENLLSSIEKVRPTLTVKDQDIVDNYVKQGEAAYKQYEHFIPSPPPPQPQPSPLDNMPPGSVLLPDGSIQTPNGTVIKPDGTIILPDGTILSPSEDGKKPSIDKQENVTDVNGTVIDSEGNITLPNVGTDPEEKHTVIDKGENGERPKYNPEDGTVTTTEGNTVVQPGGNKVQPPSGSVVQPDGTITQPDGTKITPDGTTYGADGSIIGWDGTIIRPATPVIKEVVMTGNRARTILEGECAGAQGYDYVISENIDCIVNKDYLQVQKNILLTEAYFYYVQKGTYYAYCHAWTRDEKGEKIFSEWSEPYVFDVTAVTPETPRITKVIRKGNTVKVIYTFCENALGYDVVLGRERMRVNGERRPVNYDPYVIKKKGKNKLSVTFKNVEKGEYFAGVHAWNRTSENKKKVFSPWSNQKKVFVE